jgi:hypothetical protein
MVFTLYPWRGYKKFQGFVINRKISPKDTLGRNSLKKLVLYHFHVTPSVEAFLNIDQVNEADGLLFIHPFN